MPDERATFLVRGVVQGVGFRPFVHRLAHELGLAGSVRNTSVQVVVDAQGPPGALRELGRRLRDDAPALAAVIDVEAVPAVVDPALRGFAILGSDDEAGARTLAPPDSATCPDCLRELFDPADRRHRHAFITCTGCGPRLTIIRDLPYDRPRTTLAHLPMCARCAGEYDDPLDRRFHAQPISCHDCGPRLWWAVVRGGRPARVRASDDECLRRAVRSLRAGGIVAVKGVGGFHLACSALDGHAVRALRARKGREAKPLAVMVRDLDTARALTHVSDAEAAQLTRPARPIVLLRRRDDAAWPVAAEVAPGTGELGVMLAYAPVHHLLFADGAPPVLVMTSANLSGEPICYRDEDALTHLAGVADALLGHDRPIAVPCDDSVVRVVDGAVMPLRRSRGFAPLPVALGVGPAGATTPVVLAVGGELKATACLLVGDRALLSQHLGDMQSLAGQDALAFAARHLARLADARPEAWACDLHPDYHSTRWAQRRHGDLPVVRVQHHHAHAAALLAEHGRLGDDALVLTFDGTGYGSDGGVWGGEALLLGADVGRFARVGHLRAVALPGGDAAVAEPWRVALAHLAQAGVAWTRDLAPVRAAGSRALLLRQVLGSGVGAARSTSMGRLFDAVASLLDVCQDQRYEAQAAIELEQAALAAARGRPARACPVTLPVTATGVALMGAAVTGVAEDHADRDPVVIDPAPALAAIVAALRRGAPAEVIAWAFHSWVADCAVTWAEAIRARTGTATVGLSGGVFSNALLVAATRDALAARGFEVLTHAVVPAGDGGLALGQAVVAAARLAPGWPGARASRSGVVVET
ncbi:carbamoyltransferase HypF [Xylanimonas ulmi]|uniref:Carbamoyltransferase n=1 Tax=Xylanimonas ulmi TaxID=228973 RepID=A0A4Q7M806_9MICO|nr:carbamoyltransferase HypF [Xylanibacterium ulmi]RZS62812.1 hydrogenase maturation protein HypF [Xylanibacterium ulmi]